MDNRWTAPLIGLAIGLAAFFCIFDANVLDPTNIDWRMRGDPGRNYVGWQFFRSEPWTFPPGAIRSYGHPVGTSVVFTDSIPLVAIPLKALAAVLPSEFQYFGLWILLSFGLQGLFAGLLVGRLTQSPSALALGSALLVLSPPMALRAFCHTALVSHWLLLAAIYGYLQRRRKSFWAILLSGATLVNFYLFCMAGVLWAASLVREWMELGRRPARLAVLLPVAACGASMLLAGYFTIGLSQAATAMLGQYSRNLVAPFKIGRAHV